MLLTTFLHPGHPANGRAVPPAVQGLVYLLVLIGLLALMYIFSVGNHPFIPSMEPRFGEVLREMMARGEYLIPIKNGVPYIEYPPLYYWLALAGRLAGFPDTVAIRIPGAVAFLLWALWLARLQRTLRPEWPVYRLALIGVALPGVLFQFFIAQSDTVLILGILIAMTGYMRLRLAETADADRTPRVFSWELWLGITLACLAKGPVGLMVSLPALALDSLVVAGLSPSQSGLSLAGRVAAVWRHLGRIAWVRGLALVLLFNVPWYIVVGFREGWDMVRAMVIYQNFTRFLVGFDHIQPWWYYGKTIWYDMLPMAFFFPFGLYMAWRRRGDVAWRVPALWAVATIVFFSFSSSKQGKYILTAAPAVAMLGLLVISQLRSVRWQHYTRRIVQGWAVLLVAGFAGTAVFILPHYAERIGGLEGLQKVRTLVETQPGKVVSFAWPRAMELYVLGSPMPYVRSSRELYTWLHEGRLKAGDYILVHERLLPKPGQVPGATILSPAPAQPYFEQVLRVKFNGILYVYRVLPAAIGMPVPATPTPPPHHWWDRFDTD